MFSPSPLRPYWVARVRVVRLKLKRRGNRCDREAYRRPVDEVVARVGTSLERGLASDEAHKRLQTLGANELSQEKRVSRVALFLAQFKNTLVIILLVATVLSAVLGEIVDAAIIAVIVLFCAVLSFVGNIVRTTRSRRSRRCSRRRSACCATAWRRGYRRASSCPATSCCWKRATAFPRTPVSPRLIRSSATKRR